MKSIKKNFWAVAKSERGASLVQVIVSVGIMSMLSLYLASEMQRSTYATLRIRAAISRDMKLSSLYRTATESFSLDRSSQADGTAAFRNCATDLGGNNCNSPAATGFLLRDRAGTIVAGPPANPIRYNIDNEICGAASNVCYLEAIATFIGNCPGGATPCASAETVDIRITVQQAPGVRPTWGNLNTRGGDALISAVPFSFGASGVPNTLAKWTTNATIGNAAGITHDGTGNVTFNTGDFVFRDDAGNNRSFQIDSNAGIGPNTNTGQAVRLDVDGTVRIGTAGACNGALANSVRRNGRYLELCQSGSWQPASDPRPRWQ